MIKLPIDIHPEARLEEDDAFNWYCRRSLMAANAFLQEIEQARLAIHNSPEAWAEYLYGTRRCLLKRFPFIVAYRVTDLRIEIIAIAHSHRKPGYWADRLRPPIG